MEHKLFKPKGFDEGRHAVVGTCNSLSMEERWEKETPLFAKAILDKSINNPRILDYGCGVGRLAKEIVKNNYSSTVVGTDDSNKMLQEAKKYVNDERFSVSLPQNLEGYFDTVYCVYVLQHVPAIELRNILMRIHYHLKDDGKFIYCSSDYRMCARFDNPEFFDDRFLGVNIREEISRFFELESPLFDEQTINNNEILQIMINGKGGKLAHPALVFKKKKIDNYINTSVEGKKEESKTDNTNVKKVKLVNRLSPGDVLVMSNTIRDLHKAHPGKYITDVESPCSAIYENNPYITKLEGDYETIDMQYPLIHRSGVLGCHFSEGHRAFLEKKLNINIPQTDLRPEIYLTQAEKEWVSPAVTKANAPEKYWVLNAGSKGDFTLKQYPYYQEVVDILNKEGINVVQIGQKEHRHALLNGTYDLLGKTNLRELFRTIYHAEGVITCVSLPMHAAAALNKPCVVVAGAREGTRWELYPSHQFLYVNGCLPCATYDGCWKSKHEDCVNLEDGIPRCMKLIRPEDVARSVFRYYEGGMLS